MPVIKYRTESGAHECEVLERLTNRYRIRDMFGNVLEVGPEELVFPRFSEYQFA